VSRQGYLRDQAARNTGLKFYESSHRYKLDGAWVPGVTTILGVLNKPAIAKWAASSVAEYVADNREAIEHLYAAGRGPMVAALKETPWQRRDDSAARGTTFHDFAERIVRGEEVDVPDAQVGLVESCLRFLEDYNIGADAIAEVCVASRAHHYAGKVDLFANGAIWDYKSGKRIYASTAFQLSAYGNAEFMTDGLGGEEKPLPPVEAAYGVHIREDGYSVHPLAFDADVYAEFLHIRACFDANKRAEGDWRAPGTGYVGLAHESPPPLHDPRGTAA
jgi:hypothetical protein